MRVTEIAPTHCSSCFVQKPDARHVDFDAAWDGPVINEGDKDSPAFVSIDELIICEDCLRDAGALVELRPAGRVEQERDELREQLRETRERLAGAVDHINRLEETAASTERLAARLAAPGRSGSSTGRKRKSAAAAHDTESERAAA